MSRAVLAAPSWQVQGKAQVRLADRVFPVRVYAGECMGSARLVFFESDAPSVLSLLSQSIDSTGSTIQSFLSQIPAARVGSVEFLLSSDSSVEFQKEHCATRQPGPCQQPIRIVLPLKPKLDQAYCDKQPSQLYLEKPLKVVLPELCSQSVASELILDNAQQKTILSLVIDCKGFIPSVLLKQSEWRTTLLFNQSEEVQSNCSIAFEAQFLGSPVHLELSGLFTAKELAGCMAEEDFFATTQETKDSIECFFLQLLKQDQWQITIKQGFMQFAQAPLAVWENKKIPVQMHAEFGPCIGPLPSVSLNEVACDWDVFTDFEFVFGHENPKHCFIRRDSATLMALKISVECEWFVYAREQAVASLFWTAHFSLGEKTLFSVRLRRSHPLFSNPVMSKDHILLNMQEAFKQHRQGLIEQLCHSGELRQVFLHQFYINQMGDSIADADTQRSSNKKGQVLAEVNETPRQSIESNCFEHCLLDRPRPDGSLSEKALVIKTDSPAYRCDSTNPITQQQSSIKPWVVQKKNGDVQLLWPLDTTASSYHIYWQYSYEGQIAHASVSVQEASRGFRLIAQAGSQALPHVLWVCIASTELDVSQLVMSPVFVHIPIIRAQRWYQGEKLKGWQWQKPKFPVFYYLLTINAMAPDQQELIWCCEMPPEQRSFDIKGLMPHLQSSLNYQIRIKAKIFEHQNAYAWTPATCFDFQVRDIQ